MFRYSSLTNKVKGKLLVLIASVVLFNIAGCGGGGGGGENAAKTAGVVNESSEGLNVSAMASATKLVAPQQAGPVSRNAASRFLTQATFGPKDLEVDRLLSLGYTGWLQEQFAIPLSSVQTYQAYWDARNAAIKKVTPSSGASTIEINHEFWRRAMVGQDQLRQRMVLALSEIFVISIQEGCGNDYPQGAASYMDLLNKYAFAKYRDLLEAVALHPVMGCYLSHLRNQKEDMATGRVPDENFAREVMQLFSIGLYQLNLDGSLKRASNGDPIETYGAADVAGLAKVFTGWGLACPDWPSDNCFFWGARAKDGAITPNRWTLPMVPYAKFHSTSEKRFLNAVIPVQTTPDPAASLKKALDTLANHPNVAPFISKQLIQRFVTSNPSPAYISRVATVFNSTQGDLKETLAAVLLDPEAVNESNISNPTFGKLREPILKLSALLRSYGADSVSGAFLLWPTNDAGTSLGQSILQSPSVFNFFRPGYSAPGSEAAKSGLVEPEMQIWHETAAVGYVNLMRDVIRYGIGAKGYDGLAAGVDVTLEYQRNAASRHLYAANDPAGLVDTVSQRLMYGTMSAPLKAEIISTVSSIDYRSAKNPTASQTAETLNRRLWTALLLTVASPEYQIQK